MGDLTPSFLQPTERGKAIVRNGQGGVAEGMM